MSDTICWHTGTDEPRPRPRVGKRVCLENGSTWGAPSGPTLRPCTRSSLGTRSGHAFAARTPGTRSERASGACARGGTLGTHALGAQSWGPCLAHFGRSPAAEPVRNQRRLDGCSSSKSED